MRIVLLILSFPFLFIGCAENRKELITEEYLDLHQKWKDSRMDEVKADWIPLIGLAWLEQGDNSFGSDPNNSVEFPLPAPPFMGTITVNGDSIRTRTVSKIIVTINDSINVLPDMIITEGMKFRFDNLEWKVIKRTGKYAVRIWDRTPILTDSLVLEYFDTHSKWIFDAKFEAYPEGSTYPIANVLGTVTDTPILGQLLFNYDGTEYGLDVMVGGEDTWFVIFGDKTNGEDTYGAGRYIYVPKVKDGQITKIDFNKAYNPPCAFTEHATCPLPPAQNHLPFSITAGEMNTYSDYL
jgi:uncharacterized protein (DUF1684 family)